MWKVVGIFVLAASLGLLALVELAADAEAETWWYPLRRSRSPGTPPTLPAASKYAAFSIIVDTVSSGTVLPRSGRLLSKTGPLLGQTEPWEPRIDNGYPNVIQHKPGGPWQLFYGDCVSDSSVDSCKGPQLVLYANSTDGLTWEKPNLGRFDLSSVRSDLNGTNNNVLFLGGGVGVYYDAHERDASRRYKAAGPANYDLEKSDFGVSADGIRWRGDGSVEWPEPHRFDCHNNVFWDGDQYVLTTRDGYTGPPGRTIAMLTTPDFKFEKDRPPVQSMAGTETRQLYSQVTFKWHNVYLGIVMVYATQDDTIHCRLAWREHGVWEWVDEVDLIPHGPGFDSHICFAAPPVPLEDEERLYFMGGNGPHYGVRDSALGLGRLRKDGYVALEGTGVVRTLEIKCTAPKLTVTVDFQADGFLTVGLANSSNLLLSEPITRNSTDVVVTFADGADFAAYVGSDVALTLTLDNAAIYTLGWAV